MTARQELLLVQVFVESTSCGGKRLSSGLSVAPEDACPRTALLPRLLAAQRLLPPRPDVQVLESLVGAGGVEKV